MVPEHTDRSQADFAPSVQDQHWPTPPLQLRSSAGSLPGAPNAAEVGSDKVLGADWDHDSADPGPGSHMQR